MPYSGFMRNFAKLLPLGLSMLFLAGCSTTITNMTPSQTQRTTTGLYPFSVAWDCSQQSLVKDSIQAYVLVGTNLYPMQRTPLVRERWETVVPVPADKDILNYQYKFDYQYLTIPNRKSNSLLSNPYQLRILEK
jgi:hypothetical protein